MGFAVWGGIVSAAVPPRVFLLPYAPRLAPWAVPALAAAAASVLAGA